MRDPLSRAHATPRRLDDEPPPRSLSTVLAYAGIAVLLGLVAVLAAWPRPLTRTVVFDHVDGLQAGDAVYLEGLRVGRVRGLRLIGRRVAVEIEIERRHRHTFPQNPHYFLWQDELDRHRRALRVQPGAR